VSPGSGAATLIIGSQAPGSDFKLAARCACGFMVVAYLVMGFAGSLAYPEATDNILASVLYDGSPIFSKVAVFAYSVSLIYPLPVYLILIRENLVDGGICGEYTAAMLANVVPWSLALVCYMQAWFVDVLNWSSLWFLGFINYSIPLAMYVRAAHAAREQREKGDNGKEGEEENDGGGESGGVGGGGSGGSDGGGGGGGGGGLGLPAWMKLCQEDSKAALASVFFVAINIVLAMGIAVSLYYHFTGDVAPSTESYNVKHDTRVFWKRRPDGMRRAFTPLNTTADTDFADYADYVDANATLAKQ
jgi:uncharacterized membrane protein YgcG